MCRKAREHSKPFIHLFRTPYGNFVYDVNTNEVLMVNSTVYQLLLEHDVHSIQAIATDDYSAESRAARSIVTAMKKGYFSSNHPRDVSYPDEDEISERIRTQMRHITLEVTERCNMRCRYCIFSDHYPMRRGHGVQDMSLEVALAAVELLLKHSEATENIAICFYGGEPLLNFSLIKQVVDYVNQRIRNKEISFHITTNGILLGMPEITKFLYQHRFHILVSIDGPQNRHDANRLTTTGKPTWETVVHNLEALQRIDSEWYQQNVGLSIVHAPPMDLLELQEFVVHSPFILPAQRLVVTTVDAQDTTFFDHYDAKQLQDQRGEETLIGMFARAAIERMLPATDSKDLMLARALYERDILRLHQRPLTPLGDAMPVSGICMPGLRRTFVRVDGKIAVCERINYSAPAAIVGDVWSGISPRRVAQMIRDYVALTKDECMRCWVCRLCSLCFVNALSWSELCYERKRRACERERKRWERILAFYASVLAQEPKAFDYAYQFKIE